jgi:hypothetical protein
MYRLWQRDCRAGRDRPSSLVSLSFVALAARGREANPLVEPFFISLAVRRGEANPLSFVSLVALSFISLAAEGREVKSSGTTAPRLAKGMGRPRSSESVGTRST